MTKWTYYVVQITFDKLTSTDFLELIGKEGWELASLLRLETPTEKGDVKGNILAVFKQPKE